MNDIVKFGPKLPPQFAALGIAEGESVVISRAQHEALMVAAEALADIIDRGAIRRISHTHTNEDVVQALEEGAKALAALRAAGIQIEGEH